MADLGLVPPLWEPGDGVGESRLKGLPRHALPLDVVMLKQIAVHNRYTSSIYDATMG